MYRKLLTVKEAAELLNVSKTSIYHMVETQRMKVVRIGSSIRIDPEDIGIREAKSEGEEKMLNERKAEPVIKNNLITRILPDLENALTNAPEYGEVGISVRFHEAQIVHLEVSRSTSYKVQPMEQRQSKR